MSARRRLQTAASALILAVSVAACGQEAHPKVADANNNGGYVDAGPVTYQLEISRILNQYSTEDAQYVKGLPAGTTTPTASQEWYGVFLWAKNQTSHNQLTTDNFLVVDANGTHYSPIKLDPNVNPYSWTSRMLKPLATEPGPDTTAYSGPTQGGLLLFKINTSAYSNRPLTLEILGSSNQTLGSISLDL